ncbi:MAG TPA: alpha/beta fold hydrolase [Vicinamibacterales bacterium]|nr:alpha/beta fold hydrolase [Vicinamibacterales bacterium]
MNKSPFRRFLTAAALVAVAFGTRPFAAARSVSFRTDDGVTLSGIWYEPATRPAPAVILVHMLHRTRADWEPLASRLAGAGIGVLAFDLRGHGESGGARPEDGHYEGFLPDVAAARRFVASRADVVASRVALCGASMGANLIVLDATAHPGPAGLILLSPSMDYRGLRIAAAVRKYPGPMLMVAGEDDPYASRSMREIVKAGGGVRETLLLPGAGHGTAMLARRPELIPALVDWLRKTLI